MYVATHVSWVFNSYSEHFSCFFEEEVHLMHFEFGSILVQLQKPHR